MHLTRFLHNGHLKRARKIDAEGARGLGWASIGIGLLEMFATKQVQQMLGVDDNPTCRGVLRTLGVREVMHGVGILTQEEPDKHMAAALWARVAGDVLDTALLGKAAMQTKKPASFTAVAASVAAIGALDVWFASRVTQHADA